MVEEHLQDLNVSIPTEKPVEYSVALLINGIGICPGL
jgi:hypothetical protein